MYFKAIWHPGWIDQTMIYDSRVDELAIYDAVVVQEVDASGSFTFTMPADHPYIDKFKYVNEERIEVWEYAEDNTVVDCIFGGILSEVHTDFVGNKTVSFYGYSICLHNSLMPTYDLSGVRLSDIEWRIGFGIIQSYGSDMNTHYEFSFGDYGQTVVPGNLYSGQESIYDFLMRLKDLYPELPYHFLTRYNSESFTQKFQTKLFLGSFTEISSQRIEVGSNLIDFHENILDGDFYTGVIGLGAETEIEHYGKKMRWYVPDDTYTDNPKIFWNDTLKNAYGQKPAFMIWDDITSVNALRNRCQSFCSSLKLKKELSCSVFDLSKITNTDRLEIGEGVTVRTIRGNSYLTELFYITKIERNLTDPAQDSITMKNYD